MIARAVAVTAALAASVLLGAPSASAEFGFAPGSVEVSLLDSSGIPETRAGAHPSRLIARFEFTATPGGEVDENVKSIAVDFPQGMAGDPQATPQCSPSQFVQEICPEESQVGVIRQTFAAFGELASPIYNVAPGAGTVAEFGFTAFILASRFAIDVRDDGDFGIRLGISNIPQEIPVLAGEIELWGVPADYQTGTSIPRRALLTNPTRCDGGPSSMVFSIDSWQHPGETVTASAPLGPFDGCQSLPFAPQLTVTTSQDAADSPTGFGIELRLPQNQDPDGQATSHVRSAAVTLPAGFSLSPGVAHGLFPCSDAQLGPPGTPPACPEASKLGTVELVNPGLSKPLQGSIYLGEPTGGEPFRLFITAVGPDFVVKLRGSLQADASSGRLTTVLPDLPDLPVSRLALHLKDGPRAPLASPPGCAAGTATAILAPYRGGTDVTVTDEVTLGKGAGGVACRSGAPFRPSFLAGTSPSRAGRDSAFSATVSRLDGEQILAGLEIALPAGLAARLPAVAPCPEADVATATCPAASAIGTTIVEAGAGATPLPVGGGIYLTGPYRDAPFGLALVLRARVGPFDLGSSVIRAALSIDPFSGRLTVSTDPLPQIVAGIQLRLRTVGIDIDRPGFMLNPTSCEEARVEATIASADGATAWPSSPFWLTGCRRLRFDPKMAVSLAGRDPLNPSLSIRLRSAPGEANPRAIAVKLPRLLGFNKEAGATACARTQFRAGQCPARSRVGGARMRTPLLSGTMSGPVRLVDAADVGPPELWTSLHGGGVTLIVRSAISVTPGGQIRTTVVDMPDLPLRSFALRIDAGPDSLLSARTPPCAADPRRQLVAATALRAHNGARLQRLLRVGVSSACGDRAENGAG